MKLPRNPFAPAVLALAAVALAAPPVGAQLATPRVSPKATVMQTIGVTDVTVTYSRPGVRNRTIWGELVPWDQPWRTGANEASTFTCSHDLRVNGQKLPAGTYSLITVPGRDEWTIVFSKQKELWGAYEYDPQQDQLRIQAKPQPAEFREWMAFAFEDLSPASLTHAPVAGNLVLRWEKLAVPIALETDMKDLVLAQAREEMAKLKADDWRTPYRAANFCLEYGLDAPETMEWARKSVAIQENHSNVSLLAKLHAKSGSRKEAIALAQKAIKLGKESKNPVDTSATEKLLAEWSAKK